MGGVVRPWHKVFLREECRQLGTGRRVRAGPEDTGGKGMGEEYRLELIRSSRKTVSIEVTRDGTVLVRAPKRLSENVIRQMIGERSDWIDKHIRHMREIHQPLRDEEMITKEQLQDLTRRAYALLPPRIEAFARRMGVTYGKITVRCQKTRWGSCSTKGNLNFNCLIMLTPDRIIDYVIVHELSHRVEMNHSDRFWQEVEKYIPDYRSCHVWLRDNGGRIMDRVDRGERNGSTALLNAGRLPRLVIGDDGALGML